MSLCANAGSATSLSLSVSLRKDSSNRRRGRRTSMSLLLLALMFMEDSGGDEVVGDNIPIGPIAVPTDQCSGGCVDDGEVRGRS